jgi:hypothetical protein
MGHLLNADIIEKMKNKLAIFIRKIDSAAIDRPAGGGYGWETPKQGQQDVDETSRFTKEGTEDTSATFGISDESSRENYQILRKTDEGDFHLPEASLKLYSFPKCKKTLNLHQGGS